MFEATKLWLLRVLRVPPKPDPPIGDHGSLLTFRAADNYYRYQLVLWALRQLAIVTFNVMLLIFVTVALIKAESTAVKALLAVLTGLWLTWTLGEILISFVAVRLDYEMRWYQVTDRCLRIREGIFSVREMTMTFANIQNISISQGPLQRLLGVADLEVKSAGGGGGMQGQKKGPLMLDMHTGYFRGVDNAEALRDTMRERLRQARDAGLGNPEEGTLTSGSPGTKRQPVPARSSAELGDPAVLTAVQEMLAEAQSLRAAAEATTTTVDGHRL